MKAEMLIAELSKYVNKLMKVSLKKSLCLQKWFLKNK